MDREIEWIKAALSKDGTKTQSGLAVALGLDKSSVSRLLSGGRRLKFAEARLAAAYLGVEPPMGFSEAGDDFLHADAAATGGQQLAPLFRAETAADGFWRIDRKSVVERKPRGPQLYGASSAFGIYAPDNAMAPRFKIGEIAWINPMRPVAPGDDALMASNSKDDGAEIVLLCELQEIRAGQYAVRQHCENKQWEFDDNSWSAYYVYPRA